MHTEYECTLINLDIQRFIKKIEKLGAKKEGEYFQKRYVYDLNPVDENKWIRLRTNGVKSTLTIKNIENNQIIGGTKEIELEVSNFETTNEILNVLGYYARNYQENKRIIYVLGNIEIDIDTWPLIPTYVEIEGKCEADVKNFVEKLNINKENITNYDVVSIYKNFYNIDVLNIKDLRF